MSAGTGTPVRMIDVDGAGVWQLDHPDGRRTTVDLDAGRVRRDGGPWVPLLLGRTGPDRYEWLVADATGVTWWWDPTTATTTRT